MLILLLAIIEGVVEARARLTPIALTLFTTNLFFVIEKFLEEVD